MRNGWVKGRKARLLDKLRPAEKGLARFVKTERAGLLEFDVQVLDNPAHRRIITGEQPRRGTATPRAMKYVKTRKRGRFVITRRPRGRHADAIERRRQIESSPYFHERGAEGTS